MKEDPVPELGKRQGKHLTSDDPGVCVCVSYNEHLRVSHDSLKTLRISPMLRIGYTLWTIK